ncbi:MAG: hypothetical protein ACI892_001654, partial [Marinobacter maritimus]
DPIYYLKLIINLMAVLFEGQLAPTMTINA